MVLADLAQPNAEDKKEVMTAKAGTENLDDMLGYKTLDPREQKR